jgi:hypothetical protein
MIKRGAMDSLPLSYAPAGNGIRHVITGLVPVIPIGRASHLTASGWPGLIPGSSPGTAMTDVHS